jgi:hypothetical protein
MLNLNSKNKAPSNDSDKDEDILDIDSMREYVTLSTKESIIEKNQLTPEGHQKFKSKNYRELKQFDSS